MLCTTFTSSAQVENSQTAAENRRREENFSQVLASVHFVSLCSSRREKSALKFTLIESLFMHLQRDMLSNFLSLSDFFLIHYKTRKRPRNTIENLTPPPPHPYRRNSVFGRVRDQVVTGPIKKI